MHYKDHRRNENCWIRNRVEMKMKSPFSRITKKTVEVLHGMFFFVNKTFKTLK